MPFSVHIPQQQAVNSLITEIKEWTPLYAVGHDLFCLHCELTQHIVASIINAYDPEPTSLLKQICSFQGYANADL